MPSVKDHLSVYKYNGMVTRVQRVEPVFTSTSSSVPSSRPSSTAFTAGGARSSWKEIGHDTDSGFSEVSLTRSQSLSLSQDPPPSRRSHKGFTVHWPFQTPSIVTDILSVSTAAQPALFRRQTWNPPRQIINSDDDATSTLDRTLIPDYIVNFIRGVTPETVARRKQNSGAKSERPVNVTQHQSKRSHMALLDDGGSTNGHVAGREERYAHSHVTSTSTATELQQILPRSEKDGHGWRKLTIGWRCGVVLNVVLGLVVLVAGFACFIVAGTRMAFLAGDENLYTGSCSTAMDVNRGLHALINVAVLVLLVGANYVFQVLSSPTRSEVAAAHESRSWLEIGVPSVRNLRHIGTGRAVLGIALLVVSVAVQIIYNALLFVSETGFDYNLIAVQPSFLTGSQFSSSTINNLANLTRDELQDLQGLAADDKLTTLSPQACISVFGAVFVKQYQNIILVVNDTSADNSLITTTRGGLNAPAASGPSMHTITTSAQILVDGTAVNSCRAQATDPLHNSCTVDLNGALFIVILALNLFALLMTAVTLILRDFQPLVTLGDAITSFLCDPDPATRRNALLTKFNLSSGVGAWGFTEGKYWAPTRATRWFRTASHTQWLTFAIFFVVTLALVAGALALSLASQIPDPPTLSLFGSANPYATLLFDDPASPPSAGLLSLLASLPQLLLAGLYLSSNALLTAFFLSHESSRAATTAAGIERRGLRVSGAPVGAQTASLFLTLPRPASWALAGWFAAMGFVLSQACFVVSLRARAATAHIVGVGFSGVALVVLLVMVVALGAVVAGTAFGCVVRSAVTTDGRTVGNPLVFEGGSCSAVVSARCHPVPGEVDVWWGSIAWGVVPEGAGEPAAEGGVRHVTYTAGPVGDLDGSHRYV